VSLDVLREGVEVQLKIVGERREGERQQTGQLDPG